MTFYEKYELLCSERGMKPQAEEMRKIMGVSSPAISGWKNGSMPKADIIIKLCHYFSVSSDYLLGLSELRNPSVKLTEEENLLLEAYHSASTKGKFNIITVCTNESTVKREIVETA